MSVHCNDRNRDKRFKWRLAGKLRSSTMVKQGIYTSNSLTVNCRNKEKISVEKIEYVFVFR